MTNPRDPEGLMPDAEEAGPPVDADGELPPGDSFADGGPLDPNLDRAALAGRTDTDEYGSDPDMRFPGDAEDPTMTTADETAATGAASQTDGDAMG